jgi:hypothetical protein
VKLFRGLASSLVILAAACTAHAADNPDQPDPLRQKMTFKIYYKSDLNGEMIRAVAKACLEGSAAIEVVEMPIIIDDSDDSRLVLEDGFGDLLETETTKPGACEFAHRALFIANSLEMLRAPMRDERDKRTEKK